MSLSLSLSREHVDVQPGYYELPELRRVTPEGYGDKIALEDANDQEIAIYARELAVYLARVTDAVVDARRTVDRAILSRINCGHIVA
jgi:hypothetical protein